MCQSTFPFLQLAVEIRLQIYELVLPYSEYHTASEKLDCPVKWYHGKCPSIIFVNRQIHHEATEILYRDNTFAIYIRHPRDPRLPMNESRADPESFILISWEKKSWANPRNPKVPCSVLRHHRNFHDIRRFHVSLPPFFDLLGIDVYMQKSSYAAFNGIDAWVRKCLKRGGCIDGDERERMEYIQQVKGPIDEIGELLQTAPWIEELYLSFQARDREITFATYMLEAMMTSRKISRARCFYVPTYLGSRQNDWVWDSHPDNSLLRNLEGLLERPPEHKNESHVSEHTRDMYALLQSIRARQLLDPAATPSWFPVMPA